MYYLIIHCFCMVVFSTAQYSSSSEAQSEPKTLLCRMCGETIASSSSLINIPSQSSVKAWYEMVMGVDDVLVQEFVNPNHMKFNVITLRDANVIEAKEEVKDDTWFKEHSWMFCLCKRCKSHLGWKYKPFNFNHLTHDKKEMFYGLIHNRLVENEVSDTLLLVPDSYKS